VIWLTFSCHNKADDGHIIIWSSVDGSITQRISAKQGPVVAVRWLHLPQAPRSFFLISAGADGTITLWNKPTPGVRLFNSRLVWLMIPSLQDIFCCIGITTLCNGPVENIDLYETCLAAVGMGRLSIFKIHPEQKGELDYQLSTCLYQYPRRPLSNDYF
jgi:WD40 repeat protein